MSNLRLLLLEDNQLSGEKRTLSEVVEVRRLPLLQQRTPVSNYEHVQ